MEHHQALARHWPGNLTSMVINWLLPVEEYHGHQYVILAREAGGKQKGMYDAFGGDKDPQDKEHPLSTASREGAEEMISRLTLAMPSLSTYMDLPGGNTTTIIATHYKGQKSRHVLYLTEFTPKLISKFLKRFHEARKKTKKGSEREKDVLAVVRLSKLLDKVALADRKGLFSGTNKPIQIKATVHDGVRASHEELITLRPVLVKNLRGYAKKEKYTEGKHDKIRFYGEV